MTLKNRSSSAQNLAREARERADKNNNRKNPKNLPQENFFSTHLVTGLVMLAIVLGSIFALWKPFAPRTESLLITPKTPITATELTKKISETGAITNIESIKVEPIGTQFSVINANVKTPVTTTIWKAIVGPLQTKLKDAKVEFISEAPPAINRGLDLRGGLRVVLKVDSSKVTGFTPNDLNQVRNVIENRVNQTGVAEPMVQIQGTDRIVVELPGLSLADQNRAVNLIGKTAKLEFKLLKAEAQAKSDTELLPTDLEPALLTGEAIAKSSTQFDQFGQPTVGFELTPAGAAKFSEITGNNIGKRFAILLDDKVQSAPRINGRIGAQGQITGNFTLEQANDLSLVLRSGALRVPVNIIDQRSIGPTLGADAVRQGVTAALIGIAMIFVLVYVYYGLFFGTVAALGLLFSGLVIFGMLAGLGAVLTLPGIAGLVLTIGSAVDGNVISFERIKEEMRDGLSLKSAIKGGFGHSFWTIFDVNFSHLISAAALYNYATGPVKGFAVTLAVGIIASTFSNLFFSKWLLEIMAERFKFRAKDWFSTPKFDFMSLSKFITTASVALAALGLVAMLLKGFIFGVDFTSGTSLLVKAPISVTSGQLQEAVGNSGLEGVTVAGTTVVESLTPGENLKDFTVRTRTLNNGATGEKNEVKVITDLLTKIQGAKVDTIETVGAAVGTELTTKTILAVLVALSLTMIYVAIRFDWVLGVGSIFAVAHDVFICFGLYALLGREFTITTVAAVLTLIGYSLNDSIIVSDRIRENLKVMRGQAYSHIVNVSINQTLSRTLMTSIATMLPLVALLILGGPVLRDFSFILVVGIIVGTYSSIYIVAPMAVFFKDWQENRKKAARAAAKA
jgi:SecD/SecF fusion protein